MYSIKNLSFAYEGSSIYTLRNVNLEIEDGEFLLLSGACGSGKTTLLRLLKSVLAPKGKTEGEILFCGKSLKDADLKKQAADIGFVSQNPENSLVCDKVGHELAFGLESLGMEAEQMRMRTAEMATFFGIEDWYSKNVSELSGGEKQILSLASVMVMQPKVLILDEPTSRLDPIAAEEFLRLVKRINTELGTTVIMTSHTTEKVYELCTRAAVLDNGSLIVCASPEKTAKELFTKKHSAFLTMPATVRIVAGLEPDLAFVSGVKYARKILKKKECTTPIEIKKAENVEYIAALKEVYFKYDKGGRDILSGVSMQIKKGRHTAIVGGNGAGKTTLLKLLCGIKKAYRGRVKRPDKTAMLVQNPQDMFSFEAVSEELGEITQEKDKIEYVTDLFGLGGILKNHPYDLSGGEQQRLAFAKVYLTDAELILLDEPTKGMDYEYKYAIGELIQKLCKAGRTVVTVSHDLEFCAEFADECAMLFNGEITAQNEPHSFFDSNSFYTTEANRAAKGIIKNAITVKEVISAAGGNEFNPQNKKNIPQMLLSQPKSQRESVKGQASFFWGLLPAAALTLWAGFRFFSDRRYYFISLLLVIEAMLPFFWSFEKKKTKAREAVLLSVFCALAVVGRTAFFMLPQFSAMGAMVVVAGVCFGADRGFLVGAVSAFVSNIFAGQGSWTPYQMAAMGAVGYLSGILKNVIDTKMLPIAGGMLIFTVYGLIMNVSAVFSEQLSPTYPMLLTGIIRGVPFDLIHAASTAAVLAPAGHFIIKKTRRIISKYDILSSD